MSLGGATLPELNDFAPVACFRVFLQLLWLFED